MIVILPGAFPGNTTLFIEVIYHYTVFLFLFLFEKSQNLVFGLNLILIFFSPSFRFLLTMKNNLLLLQQHQQSLSFPLTKQSLHFLGGTSTPFSS